MAHSTPPLTDTRLDAYCTSGPSPTSSTPRPLALTTPSGPPPAAPALLVVGGTDADPELHRWALLAGSGRPLDPTRLRIIDPPWRVVPGTRPARAEAPLAALDAVGVGALQEIDTLDPIVRTAPSRPLELAV